MADVGDVYDLLTKHYHENTNEFQLVTAKYAVEAVTGAVTAQNVADWWVTNMLSITAGALPDNWSIVEVRVQNLMDANDHAETNPSITGARTGTALPPYIAIGIRGPWPGRGYNRAQRRWPGGVTSDLHDAGTWNSGIDTIAGNIADESGITMELSGGDLYPCTIRNTAGPGEDPVYVIRADMRGDWEYNHVPTTQVTRKRPPIWQATS